MCLSTVYKNEVNPSSVLMNNVVSVEFINSQIVLTDLMERKLVIDGTIKIAHLTDGYIVINTK